jgi:phosphohistidine phosphatase
MRLFLLQHGEALAESVDPQRPLSDQGRVDVERVTEFVARAGVRVQRICESGKLRARQTAEIAAAQLGSRVTIETMTGLSPNDPVEPWVDIVNGWATDVLIVGHMPFLGRFGARLLAPGASTFLAFSPGSLACLEREPAAWVLAWMLRPELTRPELAV